MAGSLELKEAGALGLMGIAPAGWRARGIGRLLSGQAVIAAEEGGFAEHGG